MTSKDSEDGLEGGALPLHGAVSGSQAGGLAIQASDAVLIEALKPFAAMGRVLERRGLMTFGRTVPDSERLLISDGEVGTAVISMRDFRRAVAAIAKATGGAA